ncbi:MAG TPA: hypothetical protein VKE74_04555 [Gemmataceae bacterium]|nr:hypothetical protein [Gemmataceae bacterium]
MTAFSLDHTAGPSGLGSNEPSLAAVWQTPCEACRAVSDQQLRTQEADRVFEARVQWFLAVSRAA